MIFLAKSFKVVALFESVVLEVLVEGEDDDVEVDVDGEHEDADDEAVELDGLDLGGRFLELFQLVRAEVGSEVLKKSNKF